MVLMDSIFFVLLFKYFMLRCPYLTYQRDTLFSTPFRWRDFYLNANLLMQVLVTSCLWVPLVLYKRIEIPNVVLAFLVEYLALGTLDLLRHWMLRPPSSGKLLFSRCLDVDSIFEFFRVATYGGIVFIAFRITIVF